MVVPYVNLDLLYDPNIHPTTDSINPRRPTGQDGCQYLVSAAAALPQHLLILYLHSVTNPSYLTVDFKKINAEVSYLTDFEIDIVAGLIFS